MYLDYRDKNVYSTLKRQHNIMVLVGNGFDLAVMNHDAFRSDRLYGKTTSYADFYAYIRYFGRCREENMLYRKICEQQADNLRNWCDFEGTIDLLTREGMAKREDQQEAFFCQLENDLMELQNEFTLFLNDVVTPDVMLRLNASAMRERWAYRSLSGFLGDIPRSGKGMRFPRNTDHIELFNFQFFNFNYTSLLDNYLYHDRKQFDSHIYSWADRNFLFKPNPHGYFGRGRCGWKLSCYLLVDVIHPNGVQNVPRSMIFGTELQDYQRNQPIKKMVKSFWALNDFKYQWYFAQTELFIIFGMALSRTDSWWLYRIFQRLCTPNAETGECAELILYYYPNGLTDDEIKEQFFAACENGGTLTEGEKETARKNIYIVQMHERNDTVFLGFTPDPSAKNR